MDTTKSIVRRSQRIVVVSLPKSGTYLMGALLQALGFRSTGMHLAEHAYADYSGADLFEARRNPGRFARAEPLSKSLKRIEPGEFAVGHLPCNEDVLQATSGFERVYLTRDLRSALISYMRFMHRTGRLGARQLSWYSISDLRKRTVVFLATSAPYLLGRFYQEMVGWSQVEGVIPVRFEDLTGDRPSALRAVNSVAGLLGVRHYDGPSVLRSGLESETITKSGKLTRLDEYWSPEAEKRFVDIGGLELNAQLGCCEAAQSASAEIRDSAGQTPESPAA